MKRLRSALWWVVDVALVALVAALIVGLRPAAPDNPAGKAHDPRTCEVCRHPNGRAPGVRYDPHDLAVAAGRHLEACAACRGAGLTVARMLELNTPTPCVATQGDSVAPTQATHSSSRTY